MQCEGTIGPCAHTNARKRKSLTLYEGEDVKTDPVTLTQTLTPDSGPTLCDDCYENYVPYWQERWEAYYSRLL